MSKHRTKLIGYYLLIVLSLTPLLQVHAEETATPTTAAPASTDLTRQVTDESTGDLKSSQASDVDVITNGKVNNINWRLTKVKVTGSILTVEFETEGQNYSSVRIELNQVSYIDDATAKKVDVLKDEAGEWMAAPLSGKNHLNFEVSGGITKIWMKFPAPPASSKTISLNIPKIGALDGLEVQR